MSKMRSFTIIGAILVLSGQAFHTVVGFAISSSSSKPAKVPVRNKSSGGGGGFGKKNDSIPIQHDADSSEAVTTLVNFLMSQRSKGLTPDEGTEIGVSRVTGIRGLYATKPVKKNAIICKIPSDCALALSNPELGGEDAPTIAHGGRNLLNMYINDASASQLWKPYLDTLPTRDSNFDPTPDFFSDQEIESLEFPRAIEAAKQRRQEIEDLAASEGIPFDELQFATWLVSSRAFQISMSSADAAPEGAVMKSTKSIRVLIPFLDMINHSSDNPNAELHLIDPEKDDAWFAIKATRPIKAGKEITISYGSGIDTSVSLLANYGFVPTENRIDELMLKKGGDDVLDSVDKWTTTLADDETRLASEDLSKNARKILELRIKLKKSYKS